MRPNESGLSNIFSETDNEIKADYIELDEQVNIYEKMDEGRKKIQDLLMELILNILNEDAWDKKDEAMETLKEYITQEFSWALKHKGMFMKSIFSK
jgi:hypothetical protein